jgi:hypothetical protein
MTIIVIVPVLLLAGAGAIVAALDQQRASAPRRSPGPTDGPRTITPPRRTDSLPAAIFRGRLDPTEPPRTHRATEARRPKQTTAAPRAAGHTSANAIPAAARATSRPDYFLAAVALEDQRPARGDVLGARDRQARPALEAGDRRQGAGGPGAPRTGQVLAVLPPGFHRSGSVVILVA